MIVPQNKNSSEKSAGRISSPEQLNGYIRTSSGSVWFVLAAILISLLAIIIWGYVGHFEEYLETSGASYKGRAYCFVSLSKRESVSPGMQVRYIAPDKSVHTGVITEIGDLPMTYADACERFTTGVANRMGFQPDSEFYVVYLVLADTRENEIASVQIITDVVKPISLLFNIE